MKRILKLTLCIIITCLTWNCDKNDTASPENELNIQLQNTETYDYDLCISGDEEGAAIIVQAQHYEVSELIRNSSTNWSIVYRYKPEENYTGNDHVEIETCTGGQGVTCTNIDTIRINFTVTEPP
jgi:hypothetical protein